MSWKQSPSSWLLDEAKERSLEFGDVPLVMPPDGNVRGAIQALDCGRMQWADGPKHVLAKQLLTHFLHVHHLLEAVFSFTHVTIGFFLHVRCLRAIAVFDSFQR